MNKDTLVLAHSESILCIYFRNSSCRRGDLQKQGHIFILRWIKFSLLAYLDEERILLCLVGVHRRPYAFQYCYII